jgi:hypothetical protein
VASKITLRSHLKKIFYLKHWKNVKKKQLKHLRQKRTELLFFCFVGMLETLSFDFSLQRYLTHRKTFTSQLFEN